MRDLWEMWFANLTCCLGCCREFYIVKPHEAAGHNSTLYIPTSVKCSMSSLKLFTQVGVSSVA